MLKDIGDLEKSFREHPVRTVEDGVRRFQQHGAEFGPDKKREFLASVDVQNMFEFTGCKLDPSKLSFEDGFQGIAPNEPRYIGPLRWIIYGLRAPKEGCMAEFEPMHGRLVTLLETYPH